jgi:hypothetical protein
MTMPLLLEQSAAGCGGKRRHDRTPWTRTPTRVPTMPNLFSRYAFTSCDHYRALRYWMHMPIPGNQHVETRWNRMTGEGGNRIGPPVRGDNEYA